MQDKDNATPAQEQAARLQNLAEHLLAHPHLTDVVVHRQYLQIAATSSAETLLAWADSMEGASVVVSVLRGDDASQAELAVFVTGFVGNRTEEVWDTVPGLLEFLLASALITRSAYRKPIGLADVRRFAALVSP